VRKSGRKDISKRKEDRRKEDERITGGRERTRARKEKK
jgi:hypothetical protein